MSKRKIGMETFIKYYDKFKNESPEEIKHYMKTHEEYASNSINTKTSVGKRIFKENLERQTVEIISKARKVDEQTKENALKLLSRMNHYK